MLEVKGLRFSYGKREILKDIAFSIGEGESLFILGPNGSGKTTLLKCLNLILKPKGSVYLDGLNLKELSPKEVAKLLGYVPQRGEVSPLTVFDAVLLGRRPYIGWEAGDEDMRIAEEAIRLLRIEHLALRRLNELSGGELQLVLIARAFAQEPKYLLLDEPTNNLDIRNQTDVMRLVRDAVKCKGISAIVTVHDVNLALSYADKVLVLKDGEIYALGDRWVINERLLFEVYGIKAEIFRFDGRAVIIPEM